MNSLRLLVLLSTLRILQFNVFFAPKCEQNSVPHVWMLCIDIFSKETWMVVSMNKLNKIDFSQDLFFLSQGRSSGGPDLPKNPSPTIFLLWQP